SPSSAGSPTPSPSSPRSPPRSRRSSDDRGAHPSFRCSLPLICGSKEQRKGGGGMSGAPLMAEMTWPEVEAAARRGAVALWSVGATEQHGPHLPLSVDTLIPHELSLLLAARLDLVIAPPQVFGSRSRALSGGGQGFPGTTSLRAETLIAVLADVVGELARSGFRRIAIVNWHGENVNLLWAGVDRARERGELGEAQVMLVERVFNAFSEEELAFLFADAREGFPGWPAEHAAIMET